MWLLEQALERHVFKKAWTKYLKFVNHSKLHSDIIWQEGGEMDHMTI